MSTGGRCICVYFAAEAQNARVIDARTRIDRRRARLLVAALRAVNSLTKAG